MKSFHALCEHIGYALFARLACVLRSWTCLSLVGHVLGVPEIGKHSSPDFNKQAKLKILILRTDRLGDFILFLPFLLTIRKHFPSSNITLLIAKPRLSLARQLTYVDEVLTTPLKTDRWCAITNIFRAINFGLKELRPRKFDVTLCPRWDADFADDFQAAFFSFAPNRVSFSEKSTEWRKQANFGRDRFFTKIVTDSGIKHETDRSLYFLEALGWRSSAAQIKECISCFSDKRKQLLDVPRDRTLVGVFPGVQDLQKQWPIEYFIETARILTKYLKVTFVALGTSVEADNCKAFCKGLREHSIDLCAKVELSEMPALLKQFGAVLSCDSGGAHFAGLLDVPVVVIFNLPPEGNPDYTASPARFSPLGKRVTIIQPKSVDKATDLKQSPLMRVMPQEVSEALLKFLNPHEHCETHIEPTAFRN